MHEKWCSLLVDVLLVRYGEVRLHGREKASSKAFAVECRLASGLRDQFAEQAAQTYSTTYTNTIPDM
jgi:hypothetical protein